MSNIQSQDNVSNLISNINIDNDEKVQSQSDARLTFHSKQEVPRLVEWFNLDRNPSERQLSYYADLLNQSPLRVERFVNQRSYFIIYIDVFTNILFHHK